MTSSLADVGVGAYRASMERSNGSLRDILEQAAERVQVQNPPHAEQLEAALAQKITSVLDEQAAVAKRRLEDQFEQLQEMGRKLDVIRGRAEIALKAYAHALLTIRGLNEGNNQVIEELLEGLRRLDDTLVSSTRGN